MAKLIYFFITSLDGYVADREGSFDWAVPDDEVHSFVNEFQRGVGTYLYGRRLYEVMRFWETMPTDSGQPAMDEFANIWRAADEFASIWRAADKVVYSSTLTATSSMRTRIEGRFDAEAVRQLKATSRRDLLVGGPTLAAVALRTGLVDEIHQLVSPVVVGGGQRFLPDDLRLELGLLGERRFANGVVYLRYAVRR